ncbi:hypothetical protein [Neorhizobium alkalisoli]|uniref:hypothetical protein n=1 Tax=Neorhizobium alkalisoli TaxID=528178 RepID=UPI001FDF74A4|nr:hypothetical protein [Neorhizobium alkalisoli]
MIFSIKAGPADDKILQRILKRGRYATLDLEAGPGPDHPEEVVIIRRILGSMISSENYPSSPHMQIRRHRADLASWENEGGSTSSTFEERPTC